MFDTQAAIKAGYSEDEVLKHLTETRKFDIQGAIKSGYTKKEIIEHLSSVKKMPVKNVAQPEQKTGIMNTAKNVADKASGIFEGASNVLFGGVGKTVGGLIVGGAGDVAETIGKAKGDQFLVQEGKNLQAVRDKNITPMNIAFSALELYPGGGALSQSLKKLPMGEKVASGITKMLEHIPSALREKAIKQYSEALGAATKEMKAKTAKVVPELLNQGVAARSLASLQQKASMLKSTAGKAVREAEDAIADTATTKTKTFIDELSKMKEKYIVDGKIINPNAVKAVEETTNTIKQFGEEISTKSAIKVKRILDKSVALANRNFTKDEGLSLVAEAQEGLANSMRNILNKENPVLGEANKVFNLWSDVKKIVGATLERKSTQGKGLGQIMLRSGGGVAGFSSGEGWEQKVSRGALGMFLGGKAVELFRSPAYKTVSAVLKNHLATAISKQDAKTVSLILSKMWDAIRNKIK